MRILESNARQFGELTGTLYKLETVDGAVLAVNHLPAQSANQQKRPLIMLHGMFSNHKFWLSDKGIGIAAHLAALGFDCYLIDRRGMADSTPADLKKVSLVQCIELDLPLVQEFVYQQHPTAAMWLAHSFGGVQIASSLARGFLDNRKVHGLMFFSSQLTVGKYMLNRPLDLITEIGMAFLPHFPAKKLNMGPENESKQVMRDCVRLVSFAKRKADVTFWTGFDKINMPIIAFGSVGDTIDHYTGCQFLLDQTQSADKTFVLLGREQGFLQDYSHAGQVVSKDAIQEIWPMVDQWLLEHVEL